jgi:hypothetical protein
MTYGNGTFTRVLIDTALPFDTSSIPIEIIGPESLTESQIIDHTQGTTGSTERISERSRLGQKRCSGSIRIPCSRLALDTFLPLILGSAENANVFGLADTLPTFVMMVDRGEDVYTYANCVVARAVFSGASGGLLYLDLDIEATTETDGGTLPAVATPTESPWRLEDGVFTAVAATRLFSEFALTIENKLDTERFENTLTRLYIPLVDRNIMLATNHPWSTANTDLIKQGLAGSAASLVFTNTEVGTDILTFAMATVQYPTKTPGTAKGQMTRLPLEGIVGKMGSTASLVVTNAHA